MGLKRKPSVCLVERMLTGGDGTDRLFVIEVFTSAVDAYPGACRPEGAGELEAPVK